jgi:hypothetical protein
MLSEREALVRQELRIHPAEQCIQHRAAASNARMHLIKPLRLSSLNDRLRLMDNRWNDG